MRKFWSKHGLVISVIQIHVITVLVFFISGFGNYFTSPATPPAFAPVTTLFTTEV
jgi:hypothetical protein